jgi:hypothetical protein
MRSLGFVVISFVAFAACKEVDPAYCAMRPGINGCPDAATNGGRCDNANDCTTTPGLPVCDLADNGGTCVLCTANDHAACTGMTPRCEGHTCVACVDDNDCGGTGVCLLSGACADPSSIIHAKVTGLDLGGCGDIGTECTLTRALTEVTGAKNVIKLDDAGPYTAGGFAVAADVTIDARGATIARTSLGPIVTIPIGKTVTLLGGTIQGAAGSEGDGIQCNTATLTIHGTTIQMNDESAIDATACTLTVTGAVIRNNGTPKAIPGIKLSGGSITISRSSIISNLGGGIVVNNNGTFEIVGNVFLGNGDSFGIIGGVSVDTPVTGNRLEFNTITQNTSDNNLAAGVQCTVTGGFTAQNNIIWNNNSALGTTGIQISGCSYAYSNIGPAAIPAVNDGGNNLNVDPSFVNALSDPHLQPGTPIRGTANPAANLTGLASKDIDGNLRIAPATPGAYVAPPQ